MNIVEHFKPSNKPQVVCVHIYEDQNLAVGVDGNGKRIASMNLDEYEKAKKKST